MYSMTGYGKGVVNDGTKTITVEIKTVNHRYLDYGIKSPRSFMFLEDSIKKTIESKVSRGHIDVYLTYDHSAVDDGAYAVDLPLAKSYLNALDLLSKNTGLANDITLSTLARVPDVVVKEQPVEDEELLKSMTLQALNVALDNLLKMRAIEGASLRKDILEKVAAIESCLAKIKEYAPLVVENYRNQLNARIKEVVEPNLIDAQRLATEVALYADHCAIDEEITRLTTHIQNMRALCDDTQPVGRKMDFLVQEFNRETNTIGSKANDMRITNEVLSIKNHIEKMREQAANIE